MISITRYIIAIAILMSVYGCAGVNAFHQYARAGDTIAIAAGWKQNYNKNNITATFIADADNSTVAVLYPGSPGIRAVVNLYPDPISSLVVSPEIGTDLTPFAQTYASTTRTYADNAKELWQTTVFLDIPASVPVGSTRIRLAAAGEPHLSHIEIINDAGSAHTFKAEDVGSLTPDMLALLGRVQNYKVSITGAPVPYGATLEFMHDPDSTLGGIGTTYVSNPIGHVKNVSWSDDGQILKVIIMPAHNNSIRDVKDFRFYVVGGITNLQHMSSEMYDENGFPLTGYTVQID